VTNWIKFETTTSDKPEVWAIASRLGIDPDAVVGKLLRIWSWFDEHTVSGNATGNDSVTLAALPERHASVTKSLLDRRVGVTGFCDACIDVGWMAEDDRGIALPNFDRHNGQTAKTRALTAKRVASHKSGNAKTNARSVTKTVSGALPRIEKNRKDNTHTHTAHGDDSPMVLGVVYRSTSTRGEAFAAIAPEVAVACDRWCEFRSSIDGRAIDPIQAEAVLMDLGRRGETKAIADIDFSIRKNAKSILDSDHDFEKQRSSRSGSGRKVRVEV